MFLARPLPASAQYSHIPAAFINAWVAHPDPVAAEHIARDAIRDKHWQIMRLQEWSIVSRQTYKYVPAWLEHFDEALRNGYCLDYYLWPEENGARTPQAA